MLFSTSNRGPPSSPSFPYTTLFRSRFRRLVRRRRVWRRRTERFHQRRIASRLLDRQRREKSRWRIRGGQRDLARGRSEEHTSELQSPDHLVCRLLLEKKKKKTHEDV